MEKLLIDAIRSVLPDIDVYYNFAPEEADLPLIIIKREGGRGNLFLNHHDKGGYEARVSISIWDIHYLSVIDNMSSIEQAILSLPAAYALSAAESIYLPDGRYGAIQDFILIF